MLPSVIVWNKPEVRGGVDSLLLNGVPPVNRVAHQANSFMASWDDAQGSSGFAPSGRRRRSKFESHPVGLGACVPENVLPSRARVGKADLHHVRRGGAIRLQIVLPLSTTVQEDRRGTPDGYRAVFSWTIVTGPSSPDDSKDDVALYGFTSAKVYFFDASGC